MRVFSSLFAITVFFLVYSCNKQEKEENTDDLEFRYFNLENAGWKSRVEAQKIDAITFKATLVPIQYYLLKDKGRDALKQVDSLYEVNKHERIIEFIFEDDSGQDMLEPKFTDLDYSESVKYMSFGINKDFYLITDKNDTIQCAGILHERNFKVAPFTKILLFFSGVDPDDKFQLVYNDVLYKKGKIKFRFTDPILNL